jgi:hypothetical protein
MTVSASFAGLRVARLRGGLAVDLDALLVLIEAVARPGPDHPEVVELDLSPVLAHADGAEILDAHAVTG